MDGRCHGHCFHFHCWWWWVPWSLCSSCGHGCHGLVVVVWLSWSGCRGHGRRGHGHCDHGHCGHGHCGCGCHWWWPPWSSSSPSEVLVVTAMVIVASMIIVIVIAGDGLHDRRHQSSVVNLLLGWSVDEEKCTMAHMIQTGSLIYAFVGSVLIWSIISADHIALKQSQTLVTYKHSLMGTTNVVKRPGSLSSWSWTDAVIKWRDWNVHLTLNLYNHWPSSWYSTDRHTHNLESNLQSWSEIPVFTLPNNGSWTNGIAGVKPD